MALQFSNDILDPLLNMGGDILGAYSQGQSIEEKTAYDWSVTRETIENNKASYALQEQSKDIMESAGRRNVVNYLNDGREKFKALEDAQYDNNQSILLQNNIAYEQSAAVDEVAGTMMSRNALDAMKAEARLRAGAAGTGTSGGTTVVATLEARSVEQFDNAVIMGRAEANKLDIHRKLQMNQMSGRNKNKYLYSQAAAVFSSQGAAAAWQQGYNLKSAALPNSMKQGYIPSNIAPFTKSANLQSLEAWDAGIDTYNKYEDTVWGFLEEYDTVAITNEDRANFAMNEG